VNPRPQVKYGDVREIESYPDGPGIRVTRRILDALARNFASWNRDFFRCTGLLPVAYGERQIAGGLFKAIQDSGAQALAEPPVKRKKRGTPEKPGWADFVVYLGDTMLILEVKHAYCQLGKYAKTEVGWLKNEWSSAAHKVYSLKRAAVEDWGDGWHNRFSAVLHLVVVYQPAKGRINVQPVGRRETANYVRSISTRLFPRPNWIWLWSLNPKLQEADKNNERWWKYPAVCFLVHIKRLEEYKGM